MQDQGNIIEFTYNGTTHKLNVDDSFRMREFTPDDLKTRLGEVSADIAYWSAIQISVKREFEEVKDNYDQWYQTAYLTVSRNNPKSTENWKKAYIATEYSVDYLKWQGIIREYEEVRSKLGVITTAYNNQLWALRELGKIIISELHSISPNVGSATGSL